MNKTNNILIEKKDSGFIGEEIREQDELWCLHCYDIFPANQLKVDFLGNREGCGSTKQPGCDGAGFGVDIFKGDCEFAVGCRQQAAERKAELASMTDKEKREEYIEWSFCEGYRHKKKKHNLLNEYHLDWSSKKVEKHIKRYNEAYDKQWKILNYQERVERLQHLGFYDYLRKEWDENDFALHVKHNVHGEEEKLCNELKSLLAKKSYRDSFHFVLSELLDREKLEKYKNHLGGKHKTLFALIENISCAEDAYKISRRSSGCAYSGKRQR